LTLKPQGIGGVVCTGVSGATVSKSQVVHEQTKQQQVTANGGCSFGLPAPIPSFGLGYAASSANRIALTDDIQMGDVRTESNGKDATWDFRRTVWNSWSTPKALYDQDRPERFPHTTIPDVSKADRLDSVEAFWLLTPTELDNISVGNPLTMGVTITLYMTEVRQNIWRSFHSPASHVHVLKGTIDLIRSVV
jgi:hypothetical protein